MLDVRGLEAEFTCLIRLRQVELNDKWGGRVEELVEELGKEKECRAVVEAEVRELRESLMAKSESIARQLEGRFEEIDARVKAEEEKREAMEMELKGLKCRESQMVDAQLLRE
ncbi:hypothetical protein HPB47_011694 [Ixodes persulcatus]|uniref:Uncharacterized protein n=1 Tax=Ixodes persulcatus TaxID=34615 RepID=A0AC60NVK9_IXOPE|nr:hypothetical protein HPB47_011694 [Ixodes persulcatus]